MPNHVISTVEILGDENTIKKLKETVREVVGQEVFPLSFNRIIPMPTNIFRGNVGEKERQEHGANNWYDWRVENWGTKWNAYNQPEENDIEILESRNNSRDFIANKGSIKNNLVIIRYSFSTAWSPVSKVMEKLSEMFPEVKIKYAFIEEGYSFGGYEYFQDGTLVEAIDYEKESQLKKVEKYVTAYGFEEGKRDFEDIYKDMSKVFKQRPAQ